jgi:hypothetical protein
MNNWSPRKIWTNGMIDKRNCDVNHIAELQEGTGEHIQDDLEWFGMDWAAPAPRDNGLSTVEVDNVDPCLNERQLANLMEIDPLAESTSFGIDIYLRALDIFRE